MCEKKNEPKNNHGPTPDPGEADHKIKGVFAKLETVKDCFVCG